MTIINVFETKLYGYHKILSYSLPSFLSSPSFLLSSFFPFEGPSKSFEVKFVIKLVCLSKRGLCLDLNIDYSGKVLVFLECKWLCPGSSCVLVQGDGITHGLRTSTSGASLSCMITAPGHLMSFDLWHLICTLYICMTLLGDIPII